MSRGIIDSIIGGIELAAGIIIEGLPGGQALGWFLIVAGAGMILAGVGTLIQNANNSGGGVVSASRSPIAPWTIVYGSARVGGRMIYMERER